MSADSEMAGHDVAGARYQDVLDSLSTAYDGRAEWRDQQEKAPWKVAEREQFLGRLLDDGAGRLLEIGAGPGHDSAFFASHGLHVSHYFTVFDFHVIAPGRMHFQSLTLRRPA